MRHARKAILAGAAALLVGSAAVAATAELHHMNVRLPSGAIAQIEYVGDVAPKVRIAQPAVQRVAVIDPFVQVDQVMASMEARHRAMIAQLAALQKAAAVQAPAEPGQQLVVAGNAPAGGHYSMVSVSSTTDANGCTHTVEYRSDGKSRKPQVTRTSAGSCDKAGNSGTNESAKAPPAPEIPLANRV